LFDRSQEEEAIINQTLPYPRQAQAIVVNRCKR
jgi:hypothetical protein